MSWVFNFIEEKIDRYQKTPPSRFIDQQSRYREKKPDLLKTKTSRIRQISAVPV